MNNEINIRQLLYYKNYSLKTSLLQITNPTSQQSISLMTHYLTKDQHTVHSQQDLRLYTNFTKSTILHHINLHYCSVILMNNSNLITTYVLPLLRYKYSLLIKNCSIKNSQNLFLNLYTYLNKLSKKIKLLWNIINCDFKSLNLNKCKDHFEYYQFKLQLYINNYVDSKQNFYTQTQMFF
ncbi:unnamed protein product [Paramecium primaurelia]|uniref:Uncharacterized protein n=1 Tax=Paramecium primaurelia TaxID=5886 RepID=A0A8S1MA03_PARPR|nr:unnamed protein product [Paramecium primaurelia]